MSFVKFDGYGQRMTPRVSVRCNGQVGLSTAALAFLKIDGTGWKIELFYDPDAKLVGMRPTKDPSVAAAPVMVRELKVRGKLTGTKYGVISGWAFLERFQISFKDKTRSYDVRHDKENDLYVIDLKLERVPRRRKKIGAPAGGVVTASVPANV